jgi:hypothetical protein
MRNPAYPPDYLSRPKARDGQTQAFIARNSQAYFDKGHPDHPRVAAEALRLSAREAAAQQAVHGQPSAPSPAAKAALQDFMAKNSAVLFDRSHPQHEAAKAQSLALARRVQEETS